MGIASFLNSYRRSPLLAPLQALLALLLPAPSAVTASGLPPAFAQRRSGPRQRPLTGAIRPGTVRHPTDETQRPCHAAAKTGATRRIKIVREYETGISAACAGRMVISGRMADVCAELDRMVLKENSHPAA